jgi:hypothetical protein
MPWMPCVSAPLADAYASDSDFLAKWIVVMDKWVEQVTLLKKDQKLKLLRVHDEMFHWYTTTMQTKLQGLDTLVAAAAEGPIQFQVVAKQFYAQNGATHGTILVLGLISSLIMGNWAIAGSSFVLPATASVGQIMWKWLKARGNYRGRVGWKNKQPPPKKQMLTAPPHK